MAVENSPIVRNSFLLHHKFLLRPRTSQEKKFSSPPWPEMRILAVHKPPKC
jgi:hypothetical protein